MSFRAQFRGRCDPCDEIIEVGDECSYDADNQVVHSRCLVLAATGHVFDKAKAEVCQDCWLEHPKGRCDLDA